MRVIPASNILERKCYEVLKKIGVFQDQRRGRSEQPELRVFKAVELPCVLCKCSDGCHPCTFLKTYRKRSTQAELCASEWMIMRCHQQMVIVANVPAMRQVMFLWWNQGSERPVYVRTLQFPLSFDVNLKHPWGERCWKRQIVGSPLYSLASHSQIGSTNGRLKVVTKKPLRGFKSKT